MKRTYSKDDARLSRNRVVVLLIHDDIYVAYSLSRLLIARGCSVVGPIFDPNEVSGIAVAVAPDIILVGDLDSISPKLTMNLRERFPFARFAGFEADNSDEVITSQRSQTARNLGLDMLLTGTLSDSEIISRLQILVGGRCADVCTMRSSADPSSALSRVSRVWTGLHSSPEDAARTQ